MKTFCSLVALAFLCGCQSTYKAQKVSGSQPLVSSKSVYVAVPEGGSSVDGRNAGQPTAMALCACARSYFARAVVATEPAPKDKNLQAAREAGCDYLFIAKILDWEDEPTEWSGVRDHIGIELRTFNVSDWQELDVGYIRAKSKWATFGGDRPEDLLDGAFRKYLDGLVTAAQ